MSQHKGEYMLMSSQLFVCFLAQQLMQDRYYYYIGEVKHQNIVSIKCAFVFQRWSL